MCVCLLFAEHGAIDVCVGVGGGGAREGLATLMGGQLFGDERQSGRVPELDQGKC